MRAASTASRFLVPVWQPTLITPHKSLNPFINPSFIKPLIKLTKRTQSFCNYCNSSISAAIKSPKMSRVVEVRERIELNDKERKIFDRLRDVLTHFEMDTQLRVAGGWVRDKV